MDESYSKNCMLEKKFILDVGITNATKQEILEYILKRLKKNGKKYFIVTPNPEILALANKVKTYKNILNNAEIALPDGIGVIIAGKILGITFKERITGVELLESLCLAVAKKPITVGFLGGGEGIAEKTAECLVEKYPGLKVAFAHPDYNFYKNYNDYNGYKRIDILFVAFGAPKQERWIYENLDKLPVKVAIGVGGSFDYISGRVQRAPLLVRNLGLEWFFRLIMQPWRIKRQLALLEFAFLILKEKLSRSRERHDQKR